MSVLKKLHDICIHKNITLSTAESCTAGLISSKIVSIPGSSFYFKGSIVAYQNNIKINLLDISKNLILEKTEVSYEVVENMASNCLKKFNSDFSISTTGFAGPSANEMVPVGTIFIAVANKNIVVSKKCFFEGDRNEIIEYAAKEAIQFLLEQLKKHQ